MKKAIFLIFFMPLFSCRENVEHPSKPISIPLNYKNNYEAVILEKWNQEYLHFDSTFINGKIPLVCTAKMIYDLLGTPDKIVPMELNRSNFSLTGESKLRGLSYLIYGNSVFEKNGENVIVNTIDFESTNLVLTNNKIVLKKGIRPIDVQQVFPESGRLIGGSGNAWSGNIMISASKPNGGVQDVWFLVFRNEQLCRVVLYTVPNL